MRRLLPAAAVVVPLAVIAAIQDAPPGMVVDLDNYNAVGTTSYINAAQCADTVASPQLNLDWSITTEGGGTSNGTYRIFASDTAPATDGGAGVASYCPERPNPTANPPVNADQVDSVAWSSNFQSKRISGSRAALAASVDCGPAGEDELLYVCAHLYDTATGQKRGYASGKFRIQVAAPSAPAVGRVDAGDTRLHVFWSASAGGATTDHYVAEATPVGGGTTVTSGRTDATDATIEGLANDVAYEVVVRAYSIGGNPSPPSSPPFVATPVAGDDFWDTYRSTPGAREEGGCGAGGAGPLALGALALLALLRRRP